MEDEADSVSLAETNNSTLIFRDVNKTEGDGYSKLAINPWAVWKNDFAVGKRQLARILSKRSERFFNPSSVPPPPCSVIAQPL